MEVSKKIFSKLNDLVHGSQSNPQRVFDFHVAGVTFENNDGKSRQKIIKSFAKRKNLLINVSFQHYLYNGKDAYYVLLKNKIIGSIPSKHTKFFKENVEPNYSVRSVKIIGGDAGKSYGVIVTLSY